MRNAGALCWFLLASHPGWSQIRGIDQQLHLWTDFSYAGPNFPEAIESQQLSRSRDSEDSLVASRVSVTELRHKVPAKALAAFSHGMKFSEAGDFLRAAKNFERAASIDPQFVAARGDLGVMYLNLALPDQGAAEFRRALELEPRDSFLHGNLALALIMLRLTKEAETEAQLAVDLDSSNAKARYLLGVVLADQPEKRSRGVEQLTYAAQQLPEAHLALAAVYRLEGSDALAQMEEERYRNAILVAVKEP
ncbi:MAG TPA: tetratricopeptide repeat protein [Bryobacteraceae bacterium]|nr:tetratricopeptide repeat protein [Bryobacteraceae bacterium]